MFSHYCVTAFVNSCAYCHVSCYKGIIEDPEQDEDGLIDQPLQIITEVSESEESDEVLFEPPPMFARYYINKYIIYALCFINMKSHRHSS